MSVSILRCRYFVLALVASFCSLGCSDSPKYAEALIRVRADSFDGKEGEFVRYKITQGQLIESYYVITRALGSKELPTDLTAKQLASELEVFVEKNSELIRVRLPTKNRSKKIAERILDEILRAYENEIVNGEKLERVEALTNLRKRYQDSYDDIVAEADRVRVLSERLGASSSQTNTELEIGKQHLLYLKRRLVDLQLERINIGDEDDHSSRLDAKIEFTSELIAETKEGLQRFGGSSGELRARISNLAVLEAELTEIKRKSLALELELGKRSRVSVVQKAFAK